MPEPSDRSCLPPSSHRTRMPSGISEVCFRRCMFQLSSGCLECQLHPALQRPALQPIKLKGQPIKSRPHCHQICSGTLARTPLLVTLFRAPHLASFCGTCTQNSPTAWALGLSPGVVQGSLSGQEVRQTITYRARDAHSLLLEWLTPTLARPRERVVNACFTSAVK